MTASKRSRDSQCYHLTRSRLLANWCQWPKQTRWWWWSGHTSAALFHANFSLGGINEYLTVFLGPNSNVSGIWRQKVTIWNLGRKIYFFIFIGNQIKLLELKRDNFILGSHWISRNRICCYYWSCRILLKRIKCWSNEGRTSWFGWIIIVKRTVPKFVIWSTFFFDLHQKIAWILSKIWRPWLRRYYACIRWWKSTNWIMSINLRPTFQFVWLWVLPSRTYYVFHRPRITLFFANYYLTEYRITMEF